MHAFRDAGMIPLPIRYQVGYFLSPFDFLSELLTFFLFRVAFRRLVFPRCFMFASLLDEWQSVI
jgi:hypothetical protein